MIEISKINYSKPRFEILEGYEEYATMPQRQTTNSAGYDLRAIRSTMILAGARALIQTGLTCFMPSNMELQIRSRSGIALKNGVIVLNSPATIDSDYYGQHIGIILFNSTREDFKVNAGDRVAQGVFSYYFITSDDKPITDKREGGFGHTGGTSE